MANSKKIFARTVTFESYRIEANVLRPTTVFCSGCDGPAEMMFMSQASADARISMRNLFRLSESGLVHSVETDRGQLLICRESIKDLQNGVLS